MELQDNNSKNRAPKGRLTRAFEGTRAGALQALFLAATAPEDRAAAQATLQQFQHAARRLRLSESTFNARPRPAEARPTLLKHLRTAEQFAPVRAFAAAKQALLAVNPDVGRRIVRLATAEQMPTAAKTALKTIAKTTAPSL